MPSPASAYNKSVAMKALRRRDQDTMTVFPYLREMADRAFSRAAGAPLIGGNQVRLLRDARENYPAWLDAIEKAEHYIHFESYIIHDDEVGNQFAEALISKAREGVAVRLIYDWLGALGKASRRFWKRLQDGGVEVRCYNPPRFESPLGWLSRNHRKTLTVDGKVAFVTGLCVGRMWAGDPARNLEPWRDTGVELRGPAVRQVERAFAETWAEMDGGPILDIPRFEDDAREAGEMNVRIVATEPATAGMLRLDQLVAALARDRLWLTDAYYAGTTSYLQALRAAAKDGVDVRLLVPNGTDIPLLRPLSRAGYRPLLEAGVRIFEWNGTMLHAKTAVADGRWARVGSTNLNIASWLGNLELDIVIEDRSFGLQMEQMYLEDLSNATEVVLTEKQRVQSPGEPRHPRPARLREGGSGSRAAAGALRVSNVIGAAFTGRRVLGPVEARLTLISGLLLCALAILFLILPSLLVYPVVVLCAWGGITLVYRGIHLWHKRERRREPANQSSVGKKA